MSCPDKIGWIVQFQFAGFCGLPSKPWDIPMLIAERARIAELITRNMIVVC
jgi:hypothetical protein